MNISRLILIPLCLARATRASAWPSEASAIRAAGPRGIPNPKRRVPDIAARPMSVKADRARQLDSCGF
jgi:hypothetical protein